MMNLCTENYLIRFLFCLFVQKMLFFLDIGRLLMDLICTWAICALFGIMFFMDFKFSWTLRCKPRQFLF